MHALPTSVLSVLHACFANRYLNMHRSYTNYNSLSSDIQSTYKAVKGQKTAAVKKAAAAKKLYKKKGV